jgi:hypothetical protein
LNHPNIARILDAGLEANTFCIAFEYIAGKDGETMMHRLLSQGRMLPYEVSIAFGLGVLRGLTYAHEAKDPEGNKLGLVHRDLSPRNMMLGFNGDIKIIDFGLAHGQMGDFKTAPGMVLGTLRYVSPEQALTDPIDRRSDLYSISVVLQEMLSGRWVVQPGKPFEVLKSVISDVPPMVTELNPHLPAALGPVIAKGMAKTPSDRWQTAEEYLEALRAAAGSLVETDKAILGEFVTELFPEDARSSTSVIELGQKRFETRMRGASMAVVRPAGLSDPESNDGRTRTGYLDQTRVAQVDLVEPTELTRTAGYNDQTRIAPQDLTLIAPRYPGDAAETLTQIREFWEPDPVDGTNTIVPTVIAQDDGQTFILDRTVAHPSKPHGVKAFKARNESVAQTPPANKNTTLALALGAALALSILVLAYLALRHDDAVVATNIEPMKERRLGVVAEPVKAPEPRLAPNPSATAISSDRALAERPTSEAPEAQSTARHPRTGPAPTKSVSPSPAKTKAAEPPASAPRKASDGGVGRIEKMIRQAAEDAQGNPTRESAEIILDELGTAAKQNLDPQSARRIINRANDLLSLGNPDRDKLRRLLEQYSRLLQDRPAP